MRKLFVVLLAALVAAPAAAIDLTGSWRDAYSACTILSSDGGRTKFKDSETGFNSIEISQSGADLNLRFMGTFLVHQGYVHALLPKNVGQGLVNRCLPGFSGVSSWQIHSVTTFPPDKNGVTGRLNATYVDAGSSQIRSCRVVFERFDDANPNVPACP
jgi:hypothetical protein